MLRGAMSFDEWLERHGDALDEVWSFRPAASVPAAALLRWTGATLLQGVMDGPLPPWCDGVLDSPASDAARAAA